MSTVWAMIACVRAMVHIERLVIIAQQSAAAPCDASVALLAALRRLCSRGRRLFEFVDAMEGLPVRAVEFSSLVPPARRATHLAEFRSGRAQVSVSPDTSAGTSWPQNSCMDLHAAGGASRTCQCAGHAAAGCMMYRWHVLSIVMCLPTQGQFW